LERIISQYPVSRLSLHFQSSTSLASGNPHFEAFTMRFTSFIAVALPALALAAPTPQDPDYTFPEDAPDEDIVGGTTAATAEFPFIVSLQRSGSHFCGGSLINANTVVTAAHCSVSTATGAISGLRVRVGSNVSFLFLSLAI
jgi:hypothetical protein